MRKLRKNAGIKPGSISTKSEAYNEAYNDLRNYYSLPEDARRLARPPYTESVIGPDDVAAELYKLQSGKCIYCETLLIGEPSKLVSQY
jgi:hypothetical protein